MTWRCSGSPLALARELTFQFLAPDDTMSAVVGLDTHAYVRIVTCLTNLSNLDSSWNVGVAAQCKPEGGRG
jgi:hypothetical protein